MKSLSFPKSLILVLIAILNMNLYAQLPKETPEQKAERMEWWTDARFGMFIHWGLYAQPARHEWVKRYERITDEQYQKYFDLFNPDMFNPHEWAKMAKEAPGLVGRDLVREVSPKTKKRWKKQNDKKH